MNQWIAFKTLVGSELKRIFRIWAQTILPPAVTTFLYFVIFGHILGAHLGQVEGRSYSEFIMPGLVMMQMIMSAYTGTLYCIFQGRIHHDIDGLLMAPVSEAVILLGYMSVNVLRALIVGLVVTLVSLAFVQIKIYSIVDVVLVGVLASCSFAVAGAINSLFAKTYDDVSIVSSFLLSPLTYLGGVFYSVSMLPPFWKQMLFFNPIFYIIGSFRFAYLGIDNGYIMASFMAIIVVLVALFLMALYLFKKGVGLRR